MKTVLNSLLAVLAVLGLVTLCGCGRDGNALLEDGLAALRDGDNARAVQLLGRAAKALPVNPTVHCNLGLAYWRLGNHAEAIASLRTAADLDRDNALPLELLVQLYTETGEGDLARQAFTESQEERASPSARVLTAMAVLEQRAGHAETARDYLVQALDIEADYPPALYNMAVLSKNKQQEQAKAYFKRYLAVAEDDPHAAVARAYLEPKPVKPPHQGGTSKPPDAGGGNRPSPAETLVADARKAIGSESFDKAIILLKEAVKRDPKHREALWELATLYAEGLQNAALAKQYYNLFAERFPDDPRSRGHGAAPVPHNPEAARQAFSRGVKCYRARDWDGAIQHYQRALDFDKGYFDASYNLGLAYKAKGELERARREFAYTLSVKSNMSDAAYMLALIDRSLGAPGKAIDELRTLLDKEPGYAKAHLLLGYILQDQDQHAEARTHFERYVALAPSGDPSANKLKQWLGKSN